MARRPSRELREIRRDLERRPARRSGSTRVTYRRRRASVTLAAVVVLAGAALLGSAIAGNSGGHTGHTGHVPTRSTGSSTATQPTTSHTTTSPPTTTAPNRTRTKRQRTIPATFAVASLQLTYEEPSAANIATGRTVLGTPVRTLPTLVLYPSTGRAGSGSGATPAPAKADGPFPLIVFSQGFDLAPTAYLGLLRAWARAGYVVAAPTYPDTDFNAPRTPDEAPGTLNEADIVNHPADLRFVVSSLIGTAAERTSPLYGLINAQQIALIGHSDGGDVSLAAAANSCCQLPHIAAAVILSGAELASFGGSYFASGSPPLLVTQGSADTINVPACSVQIYDSAPAPKYYLNIPNAEHEPPYIDPGPMRTGVIRATLAFLAAYVKNRPAALNALQDGGSLPAGETLSSGPAAPPLSTTTIAGTTTLTTPVTNTVCPGA